jgi:hypothetical protein
MRRRRREASLAAELSGATLLETAVSPLWIAAPRAARGGVHLSPYRPQNGTT